MISGIKKKIVVLGVGLCGILLSSLVFTKSVGPNYFNSKYGCSFSLDGSKWKGSDKINYSVMRDGLVEYFNPKTFSTITFSVFEHKKMNGETPRQVYLFNRTRLRKASETFVSMLRSRSDRVWHMRSGYMTINGMQCYKYEVGFLTQAHYVGVIVFFIHKDIRYRFFYSVLDKNYRQEYPEFVKIFSSFKVK